MKISGLVEVGSSAVVLRVANLARGKPADLTALSPRYLVCDRESPAVVDLTARETTARDSDTLV